MKSEETCQEKLKRLGFFQGCDRRIVMVCFINQANPKLAMLYWD